MIPNPGEKDQLPLQDGLFDAKLLPTFARLFHVL
jgi:hypothetical protein